MTKALDFAPPPKRYNDGATCATHPVENALEIMPLDTSFFDGLDKAIKQCIIYTSQLNTSYLKKFSLFLLSRALLAY